MYTYPMNSRHLLAQKMNLFYRDIEPLREQTHNKKQRMRLQTDLEFQQNEIKRLNKKYNVEMFSLRVRGGKAYAAEQKIRELKKLLFKSKKTHKVSNSSKHFNPKKLIRKATANINNVRSQKYGYPSEAAEENAVKSEKFREIYHVYRLFKVKEDAERYACTDAKKDKTLRRRLREPLKVGKQVLALAERLKKKDVSKVHTYKPTTEKISFFNRKQIFMVRKIVKTSRDNYLYWISKEGDNRIIDKRFLRQELFALNDQFEAV